MSKNKKTKKKVDSKSKGTEGSSYSEKAYKSSENEEVIDIAQRAEPSPKKVSENSHSKLSLILISLIPLQLLLFSILLFFAYTEQWIKPDIQEQIQSSALVGFLGAQKIDLSKNEGDPRLSWFDPGATVIYKGFVDEVNEDMIKLADDEGKTYEIPHSKDNLEIVCAKELRSKCTCISDCTIEDVSNAIKIGVQNYYENVDLPGQKTEDIVKFTRILLY